MERREAERRALEEKVALLEKQNQKIEEEKHEKEEKLKELESERNARKESAQNQHHQLQENNGFDATDASYRTEPIDKQMEEKIKKLRDLEAAIARREAESEELRQKVRSLEKRNEEMDEEKELKHRKLTELQYAVVKREAENYELKQEAVPAGEHQGEGSWRDMAQKELQLRDLEQQVAEGRSRSERLEQKMKTLEQRSDGGTKLQEERSILALSQVIQSQAMSIISHEEAAVTREPAEEEPP